MTWALVVIGAGAIGFMLLTASARRRESRRLDQARAEVTHADYARYGDPWDLYQKQVERDNV